MIVCPVCGLKNPDSAAHCDCGRALAPGAVDRGTNVHAVVRGGRGWLRESAASIRAHWLRSITTVVALALIAYGLMRWQHGAVYRARMAAHELCGSPLKEHQASESGVAVASCYERRGGTLQVDVESHDGRLAFLNVFANDYDLPAMPALYARLMSAVAPLIDRDRLATIQEQLETLVPRPHGRFFDNPREALYAGASTAVGKVPWQRDATLKLTFDGSNDTGQQTTAWAEWLAQVRQVGWDTDLGEVGPRTIAAWQSLCGDDAAIAALVGYKVRIAMPRDVPDWPGRWSVGETWMRCEVVLEKGALHFWTQWTGPRRRLLRVRIELTGMPGGPFAALVERVVIPLLRDSSSPPNETLQAKVRRAAIADEAGNRDSPVHSSRSDQYTLPVNAIYQLEVCRADCF